MDKNENNNLEITKKEEKNDLTLKDENSKNNNTNEDNLYNNYLTVEQNEKENNQENISKENNEKISDLLKKIDENKNQISKLSKEKESLELQNYLLATENQKLNNKLKVIKESVIQLKSRLESDIYNKLEQKTKLLQESQKKIESLNKDIENLKLNEEELKTYREKVENLIKEKADTDSYLLRQEENIKNLETDIQILNKECKEKDIRYKKLDEVYLDVINIIEEHKKTINNLKMKLANKEKDEKNVKMLIYQKDQEILLLRNFINSYKNGNCANKIANKKKLEEINNNNEMRTLHKNKSSVDIKNNYKFKNNNSKILNLPKVEFGRNKYNENNNIVNKKSKIKNEDDNLKEITTLMNKMIND